MNIFFLDVDLKKCAEYHMDSHVSKMPLETAQLLCTTLHLCSDYKDIPYKPTHQNHPCAIWNRECIENYKRLCNLGLYLCKEYTYRYNKIHASQDVIIYCATHLPNLPNSKTLTFTTPLLAMDDMYKKETYIESYRNYYIEAKQHLAKWKNRNIPYWFIFKK